MKNENMQIADRSLQYLTNFMLTINIISLIRFMKHIYQLESNTTSTMPNSLDEKTLEGITTPSKNMQKLKDPELDFNQTSLN